MAKKSRKYGFLKEKLDKIVAYATRKGDKKQDEKNPLVIRKIKKGEQK